MHEDEPDEGGGEQNLDDCEHPEHVDQASSSTPGDPWYGAARMEAEERIRKLVVLGDSRVKQGLPGKARETYAEALELARGTELEKTLGPLIEQRLADLDASDAG